MFSLFSLFVVDIHCCIFVLPPCTMSSYCAKMYYLAWTKLMLTTSLLLTTIKMVEI